MAHGTSCARLTTSAPSARADRTQNNVTVHGFRSSFRDWAGDATAFPREVAEAALAHAVGDETELSYRRSDALEKRRKLMDAWARFCCTTPTSVVQLRREKPI